MKTTNEQQLQLSLRDWFAGMALMGQCALQDERVFPINERRNTPESVEVWRADLRNGDARQCYEMADAMLKAREAIEL